jgi:hypothetical protein
MSEMLWVDSSRKVPLCDAPRFSYHILSSRQVLRKGVCHSNQFLQAIERRQRPTSSQL